MADMNIGNLVAGLTMDTSGFAKGLASASGGLDALKANIATAKTALIGLMTNPAVLAVAAITSLGAIGKAAFDMSEEVNTAYDYIRIGTGATGEALDELKSSFDAVFTNVPADAEEVSTAIADLNTRLGLTGVELERLATQFIQLSRVTESDIGTNIKNLTRLFGDWSVAAEDYEDTVNSMFKISQATGIEIGALSSTVVQYGASLRNMGFSLEEASAMLGKFEKEGVNTETVLSSMRIALAGFAEQGIDARAAFSQVIDEIQSLDESAGNALAMDVFGTRAGSDMAAAIREGRFEFDELMQAIEDSPETVAAADKATMGFAEQVEMLWHKVMTAMTPLGSGIEVELDKAFQLLNGFADNVLPHIISFIQYVGGLIDKLREPFEKLFARIGESLAKFWGDSEGTTGDALTMIADLVTLTVDNLAAAIDFFFDFIYPVIEAGLGAVVAIVKAVSALISGDWDYLWNGLMSVTATILQGITDLIFGGLNAVLDFVEGFVNSIIDGINSVIAGINSLTGTSLSMLSRVDLNVEAPDVAQLMGIETAGGEGVSVVQNITVNGDITDPSKTFAETRKQAYLLAQGVNV